MFQSDDLKKRTEPLTKEQILQLRGGEKRGEVVFLFIHTPRENNYQIYELKVRNQNRSQKPPAHPEGFLFLTSEVFGKLKNFKFDVATGTVDAPCFQSWVPGKIVFGRLNSPAQILRMPSGSDEARLLRLRCQENSARVKLLRILRRDPDRIPAACELLREALKMNRATTDPAILVLRWMPCVGSTLADSVREAIALPELPPE